jgi:hypothetical protein
MLQLNPLIPARYITVRKAKPDQLSEIEALAAKLEPKLAKAIMELLSKYQSGVDLDAIVKALQAGDVGKVIGLIAAAPDPISEAAVVNALEDGVWAAGALTAVHAGKFSSVSFQFNRLNPRLIDWLQGYSLGLIRQINADTKQAIRDKLVAGMTAGDNPIKTARDIKTSIGLTPKQSKAVENYRKELESFHLKGGAKAYGLGNKIDRVNGRQVFKPDADGTPKDGIDARRLRDFRFDGKLKSAMASGKPIAPAQIDKMVEAYARKYRQFRSQTIARTEALRATNFGVQDAWRQIIEKGAAPEDLVRRQWIVTKDERRCEICAPIPSMNPKKGVPFSQAFNTPKGPQMLPPIHPNCRCTVFIRRYEPEQLVE